MLYLYILYFLLCVRASEASPQREKNQLRIREIQQKLISYCHVVSHIYKIFPSRILCINSLSYLIFLCLLHTSHHIT